MPPESHKPLQPETDKLVPSNPDCQSFFSPGSPSLSLFLFLFLLTSSQLTLCSSAESAERRPALSLSLRLYFTNVGCISLILCVRSSRSASINNWKKPTDPSEGETQEALSHTSSPGPAESRTNATKTIRFLLVWAQRHAGFGWTLVLRIWSPTIAEQWTLKSNGSS